MKRVAWLLPLVLIVAVASWGCNIESGNPAKAEDSGQVSSEGAGTSSGKSCCGGTIAPKSAACEGCGSEKGSPECCTDKPK